MSILYIRLPARVSVPTPALLNRETCAFALATSGRAVEREGSMHWADLGPLVASAEKVVLLLAASDVNVLRVNVPPVNSARLKAMLPALVEDSLMSAPEDCVIVASRPVDGVVTVAVTDKAWMEALALATQSLGARAVQAVPAQLSLAHQQGAVTGSVDEFSSEFELVVRLSEHEGLGLALPGAHAGQADQTLVNTLETLVPEADVQLYVQQAHVPHLQNLFSGMSRVKVVPDSWSRRLEVLTGAGIDLMSGIARHGAAATDWKRWRWSMILLAVLIVANAIPLNVQWLRMKREADALRASINQTFRSTFPKLPQTDNPIAQMRQKLQALQHDAGQAAPDDFVALSSAFGEEWRQVAGASNAGLASVEYKEHALIVRPKPEGKPMMEGLKSAMAAHNLTITSVDDNTWKIVSNK